MELDILSGSIVIQIVVYALNWYFNLNLPWFVLWSPIILAITLTLIIVGVVAIVGLAIMIDVAQNAETILNTQLDEKEE
jgi:hypothetical protein